MGTGGYDKEFRANAVIACFDRVRVKETAIVTNDVDAQPFKPLLTVVWLDRGDGIAHVCHGLGIINRHLALARADAIAAGFAHDLRCLGDVKQGFGRDAPGIQTITAHLTAFDQNGAHTQLRRAGRHVQSARTSPDDTDIGLNFFHGDQLPAFLVKKRFQMMGSSERAARASNGPHRLHVTSVSESRSATPAPSDV